MISDCAVYVFNQVFICNHENTSNRYKMFNVLLKVTNDIYYYNVCIVLVSHKRKLISMDEILKVSAKLKMENVVSLSSSQKSPYKMS